MTNGGYRMRFALLLEIRIRLEHDDPICGWIFAGLESATLPTKNMSAYCDRKVYGFQPELLLITPIHAIPGLTSQPLLG
jgi:hypothetical protein